MRSLKFDFEVRRHILFLKRGYKINRCLRTCLININEQICAVMAVLCGGFLTIFYKAGLR